MYAIIFICHHSFVYPISTYIFYEYISWTSSYNRKMAQWNVTSLLFKVCTKEKLWKVYEHNNIFLRNVSRIKCEIYAKKKVLFI